MITIACVLRTSGPYDADDVLRLHDGIRRHMTMSHSFYCLTNLNKGYPNGIPKFTNDGIIVRPLEHNLPGWWSKIELFRLPGPLLYFDLDTVLTNNIDGLCESVLALGDKVLMLRGFRRKNVASGIMGWAGNMNWIIDWFCETKDHAVFFESKDGLAMQIKESVFLGDQDWLSTILQNRAIQIVFAQDVFPGIYSYKNHIRDHGLPDDAAIVCFHGRPRPADIKPAPAWLHQVERLTL